MSDSPLLDELENGPWPKAMRDISEKDAPMRCPSCQAVWKDNARFCGYCGTKLEVYNA